MSLGATSQPPACSGQAPRLGADVGWGLALGLVGLAYDPAAPAATAKAGLGLLVGLALLASVVRVVGSAGRQPTLPMTSAGAAWLALFAWNVVSTSWADRPSAPLLAVWGAGAVVLLGALGHSACSARRMAGAYALAVGTGSAAAAIVQALTGANGMMRHGLQGNPNWLGLVLAMTLPLQLDAACALWRAARRVAAAAAGLGVVTTAAGLVLAGSRVAWIALAGAALVAAWIWPRRGSPPHQAHPRRAALGATIALSAAVLLALVSLAIISPSGVVSHEPESKADVAELARPDPGLIASWHGRLWIWEGSLVAAVRALPLGVGLGDVHASYLEAQARRLRGYEPAEAARRFVNATTAHQDWIEAAQSGGLPALALLVTTMALALGAAARSWAAGAAALLCLAFTMLGDSPLQQPAVVLLLALLLAAAPRSERGPSPVRLGATWLVHAAGWGALVLLLPALAQSWLASRLLAEVELAEPGSRIELLERAEQTDPRSGTAALRLGLEWLANEQPARALPHLSRAERLAAGIAAPVAAGNAWLGAGEPVAAVTAFERALALHPGSFRAHANLAEALRRMGALERAEHELAIAKRLQPGHPKLTAMAERLRRDRVEAELAPEP